MDLTLLSRKKLPFWEILLIIYLFVAYLVPSFSLGSTTLLLLLLVYCAYIVFIDSEMFTSVAIPLLLIFALAAAYALLTDASSIAENVSNRELKRFISKFYQYLTIYFPAILFIRINRIATKKQKILFAAIGIALMVYVIITTWIYLIAHPGATKEWESFEETNQQDIANYHFIYAIPVLISVISIVMLRIKGIAKPISLALILVGIVFLVNAQYTLSILITIIGVLVQLFRNIRSTLSKALFVLAMLAVAVFLPTILEIAIAAIPHEQVTERLREIHAFLTGQGAGGYNLNGRLTLYGKTILAFFKSPIWGHRHLNFDGHATFLTILSDTGILGGIPFYALFVTICREVKSQLKESRSQFGVIIFMFVMMGVTNPVHASLPLGLATWFLAPLTIQLVLKEDSRNGKSLEN